MAAPAPYTSTLPNRARFVPVRMGSSPDVDLKALITARNKFYQYLLHKTVTITYQKRTQESTCTQLQAAEITNFIFTEVIGGVGILLHHFVSDTLPLIVSRLKPASHKHMTSALLDRHGREYGC
jgi:hypothetical protein